MAQLIVKMLLEDDLPDMARRVVRVRTPQGVVQAEWNGYYDARDYGKGILHSIGYPNARGEWSHTFLRPGDEILDSVPSFEEWEAWRKEREKAREQIKAAIPPKAAEMQTSWT